MARMAWRYVAALVFGLWACTGIVEAAPQENAAPASTAIAAQPMAASAPASYRLGVDDKVTLTVLGEQELSKEYQVGPDGYIEVPLIGRVLAQGKTIEEFSTEVRTRLADGYIRSPSVSGMITSFRPFYILGEVNKPGEYPYREGLTVVAAVATAQGYTYRAQKRYVLIRNAGSADAVRTTLTPGLLVQPGQTIIVQQRYF